RSLPALKTRQSLPRFVKHLKEKAVTDSSGQRPPGRAPPQKGLFDVT
ncbi:MAG: hypothetical protein ACI9E4_000991, partial [Pseudohongiellaceae bacterium]